MHQINLNDRVYQDAQRRAAAAGFASVEEYIVDLVQGDLEGENLDRYFTPERLAQIDRAAAEMDAGQGISLEEFDRQMDQFKV